MNLIIRAISALIALIVLVFTLETFNTTGAIVLITFVASLISLEITQLFNGALKYILSLIGITVASLSLFYFTNDFLLSAIPHFFGFILVPWCLRQRDLNSSYQSLITQLLVFLYCFLTPVFIFEIIRFDSSLIAFYFFGLLVFGTDTLAYLFGNLFGKRWFKTPYQPLISPSKTFEGFVGSLIWPLLVYFSFIGLGLLGFSFAFLGLIYMTAFAAISGDLIASLIKRKSDKKDSGKMMPGHGGFLDRLDSLLMSAPFFFLALRYLPV